MEMELTGLWRFCPDPDGSGAARGYAALNFDDRSWREVWLPADFEMCAPELDGYQGVGWFRRLLRCRSNGQGAGSRCKERVLTPGWLFLSTIDGLALGLIHGCLLRWSCRRA